MSRISIQLGSERRFFQDAIKLRVKELAEEYRISIEDAKYYKEKLKEMHNLEETLWEKIKALTNI